MRSRTKPLRRRAGKKASLFACVSTGNLCPPESPVQGFAFPFILFLQGNCLSPSEMTAEAGSEQQLGGEGNSGRTSQGPCAPLTLWLCLYIAVVLPPPSSGSSAAQFTQSCPVLPWEVVSCRECSFCTLIFKLSFFQVFLMGT